MHEHAKKIWKAALDGKTVQRSEGIGDDDWEDKNPFESVRHLWPQSRPNIWRIKPQTIQTRMFRVYLDPDDLGPYIFEGDSDKVSEFEKKPYFGGWLTDWITYEVGVEE